MDSLSLLPSLGPVFGIFTIAIVLMIVIAARKLSRRKPRSRYKSKPQIKPATEHTTLKNASGFKRAVDRFQANLVEKNPSLKDTSKIKGDTGEFAVSLAVRHALPKDLYHLMDDVTLRTERGGTTQIDHIIVSCYGVFVIETKNWAGRIFGKENAKSWIQLLNPNGNPFRFYNPLKQNQKHAEALGAILKIPAGAIHPLVVFTGDATFKRAMPANVVDINGFIPYLQSKQAVLLQPAEAKIVISMIEQGRLERGNATDQQHIRNLRQKRRRPA